MQIKTQSKKKDVLVILILQETKNFNLFDKTVLKLATLKASSEEVIVMYSEKMKAKYMKEGRVKEFFSLTCRLASRNFIID